MEKSILEQTQALNAQARQTWDVNLNGAGELLNRALQIILPYAPESLEAATSLHYMGIVLCKRGIDYAGAEQYVQRGLDIRNRLAPDSIEVAQSLNILGVIAADQGDYLTALHHFQRSLAPLEQIRSESPERAMEIREPLANGYTNLGNLAYLRRDLPTALNYFLLGLSLRADRNPQSLEVTDSPGDEGLDIAESLSNLGITSLDLKQVAHARKYHTRALTIRDRLAQNQLAHATSLYNLGLVAQEESRIAEAEGHSEDAERLMVEAEALHTQALEIRERLSPHYLDLSDSLVSIGQIAFYRQDYALAGERFEQAVAIIEDLRAQIATPNDRAFLIAAHTSKFAALLQTYLIQGNIDRAFYTLERARARSLLELLTDRSLDLTADADAELTRQENELGNQRAELFDRLNRLAANEQTSDRYEELKIQDHMLDQQQQKLKEQLYATSSHYASIRYPQPLTLAEAHDLLEPGTLMLSYLVDGVQTFLFVLTADRPAVAADRPAVAHVLPIGRATLQERVSRFINSLQPHQYGYDPDTMAAMSRQLYADLIGPAHEQVRKAKRLVICPDGPLLALPFGALDQPSRKRSSGAPGLNSPRQPRYLGAEKPLRTIFSATLAGQLQQRAVPEEQPLRLLAVGNPRYYSPKDETEREELRRLGRLFEPLSRSHDEVKMLAELFGESATIRLEDEATRRVLIEESAHANLIHLACHASFNQRLPLHSWLALSQPETLEEVLSPQENGLLPAWEIFQRLRLQAELVTLSACRTGQGQEIQGEGLIGLARAFQYAGARNLVVTLWKIDDRSTFLFMQAFYTALREGMALDEALHRGILTLRKHKQRQWNHPYYWAAFLLIGNAHGIGKVV